MHKTAGIGLVLATLLTATSARGDLASAQRSYQRGDYQQAIDAAKQLTGADVPTGKILAARALFKLGKYDQAERITAQLVAAQPKDKTATVYHAELLHARGKTQLAIAQTRKALQLDPRDLRARWMLGRLLHYTGQRKQAYPWLRGLYDDFNAGKLDKKNADHLFYVAEASRYLAKWSDAHDAYNEAVLVRPTMHIANVNWGYMLLRKYAIGDAQQSFEEILKTNPKHPDAHAGLAQVKLEQSYDLAAASRHVKKALAINPKHIKATLIRAQISIDQNRWELAKTSANQVLAINPNHVEARALLATVFWLRDNKKAYESQRRKVLQYNPRYAEFFHIIARSAVREHRYKNAIELEKQAVKTDPSFYEAMQEIGSGYLRLGQEKQGLKWLRKAWKGDQFNARTLNLLELYEKDIPNGYTFADSKSFRIRYHRDEVKVLRRFVAPHMERAFADMVSRYRFKPKTPVILELYNDPNQYSVRTVGLPNLGALGVCFGQVVTAQSPSDGNINWGMVLWHELAHVFHIQLSDSRVPRWYTEGLAEYETLRARPEWRRENDSDLWAAVKSGEIPSIAKLNYQFMKPNMQTVLVAYHLSSVVMEYIATTYGFAKIVDGLKLFAKGQETPGVIKAITGRTVAEFDAEFLKYLHARLQPYKNTYQIPSTDKTITELEVAKDAAPTDLDRLAELAIGYFEEGNAAKSLDIAERLLAKQANNKTALYIKAEISLRSRKWDDAKAGYRTLIKAGGDNFDIRVRLATIAKSKGDTGAAIKQLRAAKALDPERGYPYLQLAEIYKTKGQTAQALHELETYVLLEQMQYKPLKDLITGYAAAKNWSKVVTFAEMAINNNPFDAYLHLQLGEAYLARTQWDRAIFAFESALIATNPQLRRPALVHTGLAKAYLAKGQRKRARKAVDKALRYEPTLASALRLRQQL